MTIGILGGSFCPPTIAHIEISNLCIEKGLCDKVIWVPVNDAYKKSTNIHSSFRTTMVQLALADQPNIDASFHEIPYKIIIKTVETMKMLRKQYPNDTLLFIAGADKINYRWFQEEEFVRDFGYIILNRGNVDVEKVIENSPTMSKWKKNIKVLNYDSNISSTLVRQEVQKTGHSDFVTKEVMKYIKYNKLFQKK